MLKRQILTVEVVIHLTTKLLKPKYEKYDLAMYKGEKNHSYYSEYDRMVLKTS